MPLPADTLRTLETVFGFAGPRPGQEAVVSRLLAGRSVLAVFPTGAGKSLCYQLPALQFAGPTIVISPLIALMKDQIDFLASKKIAAARLDSTLDFAEYRQTLADFTSGKLKLLYIAPERLANESFLNVLRRTKLDLLAVDEAHCISEWGHNFRPDYLKIAKLSDELRVPRVLALTATATPAVADDIAKAFGIAAEDVVRTAFHRPNLHLHVAPCRDDQRPELLRARLRERPRGPTIVYVTLQHTAEVVADQLTAWGFPAKAYHAGLGAEVRTQVQDWFMASPAAVVVATIAFGMGIDKADIRAVYHFNLPKTLENYAQEIGRSGRDGEPAHCELFAAARDRVVLENFTYGDTPDPDAVSALVEHLLTLGEAFDLSTYDLSGEFDVRPLVLETLLTYLELEGVLQSVGTFYAEYKFQPLRPSQEILAKFDATRVAFLTKLFKAAKKGTTWFAVDMATVPAAIGEERSRIAAALNYLNDEGDLKVERARPRQQYRRRRVPNRDLVRKLVGRFADREHRDIARLERVLDYVRHTGCRTDYVLAYFGERATGGCGHCDWCTGARPEPLPPAAVRSLGAAEGRMLSELRAEAHEALTTARQMARFLCGLSSPAAQRAKLGKHAAFGALRDVPFATVMEWAAAK